MADSGNVDIFIPYLKLLAPGTQLRIGLENILFANTGGLIVLGNSSELTDIVSGGLEVNCDFSPARLYELSKMDGAIILNNDASRILAVNAQLDPDPALPSEETGIRHRTAERVARQTGLLVIAVSQRRNIVTLYLKSYYYRLRTIDSILVKANQALQTLEKYRSVLSKELQKFGSIEFEDIVSVFEVSQIIHRGLRVLTIAQEIENYIIELGIEGRLVKMQLEELLANIEKEILLIIKDYSQKEEAPQEILKNLLKNPNKEIFDALSIAKALNLASQNSHLEATVPARGHRMLNKVPRIPGNIIDNLVNNFMLLSNICDASIEALDDVEGIGEVRARSIKQGLKRLQEQLSADITL